MTNVLMVVGALLIAAFTTGFVTPLVRQLAAHVGMVDEVGERRMHEQPKPRIGGIAVYLGFALALFSLLGYLITKKLLPLDDIHNIIGMLFGATLILVIGIWDDVMGMRPRDKLIAQIVVAGISLLYGFYIPGYIENPFHHGTYLYFPGWLGLVFTMIWYVGMMNAINFIDGLDGLLPGLTAISGASLVVIELTHGHPELALVLAALVGGAAGFLPYNFNPAKIILGDSGALFIGYIFATISIIGESKTAISISLVIPLVVLALPILDTAVTIVRRTRAGKKITEADRGHFHHQLIFRFGLNVRQAVLLIYALCVVLGVAAILISGSLTQRVAGL